LAFTEQVDSSEPSSALAETPANSDDAIEVSLPDNEINDVGKLKKDWQNDLAYTRDLGSKWLASNSSLALLVPSAIVTVEMNVLLNPAHPTATGVKALRHMPFPWDARLF
jgi:RES domain-containing protein